jgi:hypothetical protein
MNKIFLMILIISAFLFSSCKVDDKTGLIIIDNKTYLPIRNLTIGPSIITLYVAPGGTYDYWYYSPINGSMKSDSIQTIATQKNLTFNLNTSYSVYIKAYYQDQREVLELSATGIGKDLSLSDYSSN